MLKKIVVLALSLAVILPASAQNYSTNASLKEVIGNYAVVESTGIAPSKKEAIEMAKKSVIYTYLFQGIDGLNDGDPVLSDTESKDAKEYINRILGTSNYANYIRNCTIADQTTKTADKQIQVFATVELYHQALKRTLEKAGLSGRPAEEIKMKETQQKIAMPTVMVVPFRKDGQSYVDAYNNSADIRLAISNVNEAFINEGVETKDLRVSLNNAETYAVRMGDNMSLDDMILINSGADISVNVEMSKDVTSEGTRLYMRLQAVELATGNTLADVSAPSGRKRASVEMISMPMSRGLVQQLIQQVSTRLATKIETGQAVSVRFTIDPNSAVNMSTEIVDYTPLSDLLVGWVKRHALNGRYHSQGRTSTLLAFSDIYIDNSVEDGMQSDINDFALALYQYMRRDLGLMVERTITGNSVEIIIY